MTTKERLANSLEEIGIFLDVNQEDEDLDLREYILDSLQFITAIVQIEKVFHIEFPTELLLYDNLTSLQSFCEIIDELAELRDCLKISSTNFQTALR